MKQNTRQITRTAALLALLVILQAATKPAGQLVTGSCVNAILAVAALLCGLWPGVVIAAVSPFAAFLLGIGPQLIAVVPAISLGNVVYVVFLCLITGKSAALGMRLVGLFAASCAKFATLYLVVLQLLCRVMPVSQKQVVMLSTTFNWPQLVTALIGGALALLIVPLLKKARKGED